MAKAIPQPASAALGSDLDGRCVLVTGGTTGIGRATAILLAQHGANVMVFGRSEQALQDAFDDFERFGCKIHGTNADQADQKDILRVFREVDSRLGGLDILVNNAAISADSIVDEENWRYVIESNLNGYLSCTREAIRRMRPRRQGAIVNIGSVSADKRGKDSDVYVATKSAIQGFSYSLAEEVAGDGIGVTLIEPGLVGTDFFPDMSAETQREMEANEVMLTAEDIAECVLFALTRPKRCRIAEITVVPLRKRDG